MRRILFGLCLLAPAFAAGDAGPRRSFVLPDAPAPAAKPTPTPTTTPMVRRVQDSAQAHLAARLDAQTLLAARQADPAQFAFVRWVWVPPWWEEPGDAVMAKLVSLTLNYVSRSENLHRPPWLPPGRLVRVDLRRFAPDEHDLAEWLRLWEEFRFDPNFSRLVTKDTLDLIRDGQEEALKSFGIVKVGDSGKFLVACRPYRGADGEWYSERWVDVVRFPSPHLDPGTVDYLEKLTGSEAPVVEANYLMFRALSTIKDAGVYRTVFGGLYYDLAGIKTAKQAGREKGTDEDEFFRQAGLGDVDRGVTAQAIFDRVRSDERAAMFRSKVTGKPRRIDVFPALSTKPRNGLSLMAITHDIRDQDVDVKAHPLMNLENFQDFAREAFYPGRNGLLRFALFNKDGKLQEKAPPDVVKDHKIPPPHTADLQGAVSCIRCHGVDGSDGWQPVANDVLMLRKRYLDAFADLDRGNLDRALDRTLDRLAGRYGGEPEPEFRRARADYNTAVLTAAGPWKEAKDQTEVGRLMALAYERVWSQYAYATVDTRQALREVGWDVPPGQAQAVFRGLVPPDPSAGNGAFVQEDVRAGALAMSVAIGRTDWELVKSFVATRAKQNAGRVEALLEGVKK